MEFSLKYKTDIYDGVIIEKASLYENPEIFEKELFSLLLQWKDQKKRGVWLKIPKNMSSLIPIAIKLGFDFHHTQTDYLMLTKWLPDNEKNNIPSYSTHYIGVGGAVINQETNEILVVQENRSIIKDFWKLPGGLLNEGEFLSDAAIREVFEETGVKTEFVNLLTFRETKNYRFGKNDIYFVVLLRPLSNELVRDEQEIKRVKWMKLDEYLKNDKISAFHSIMAEALNKFLNKNEEIQWKKEDFTFLYGKNLREQVMYYSPKINL